MRRGSSLILFVVLPLFCFGVVSRLNTKAQSPPAKSPVAKTTSERVDSLETRSKELESAIDRAALKNDYIQQIQKQYETYYEKAFSTQLQILTILGIILSVLLFLAGRFGLSIFDRQIQLQLKSATDSLRSEFGNRLDEQLKSLSEMNAARLKELENGLVGRISILDEDLQLRSDFQFQFTVGIAAHVDKEYQSAVSRLRNALSLYVKGKDRRVIPLSAGVTAVRMLLWSLNEQGEPEFDARLKKELENEIYQSLDEELTRVASDIPELLPLLKK